MRSIEEYMCGGFSCAFSFLAMPSTASKRKRWRKKAGLTWSNVSRKYSSCVYPYGSAELFRVISKDWIFQGRFIFVESCLNVFNRTEGCDGKDCIVCKIVFQGVCSCVQGRMRVSHVLGLSLFLCLSCLKNSGVGNTPGREEDPSVSSFRCKNVWWSQTANHDRPGSCLHAHESWQQNH